VKITYNKKIKPRPIDCPVCGSNEYDPAKCKFCERQGCRRCVNSGGGILDLCRKCHALKEKTIGEAEG